MKPAGETSLFNSLNLLLVDEMSMLADEHLGKINSILQRRRDNKKKIPIGGYLVVWRFLPTSAGGTSLFPQNENQKLTEGQRLPVYKDLFRTTVVLTQQRDMAVSVNAVRTNYNNQQIAENSQDQLTYVMQAEFPPPRDKGKTVKTLTDQEFRNLKGDSNSYQRIRCDSIVPNYLYLRV